ncbi:MAG: HD domain-containing protein [Propionivibrio sp.]|uniref:HD domain-containing phosphohydrolase n=1 Tax=Propionivibrio sp. TaxID=2212460 RepID=UPI001B487692|nr:HD domain-containing phosphohydrolase [Propionivibrio sp.]MBP7202098.1 HD domain-containing protein [Propionivibrio sp.]
MSPHDHDLVLHADLRHVIYALSDALDLVGIDDIAHGKRVGIMAAECAQSQGWPRAETAFLFDLGLLHDAGVSSTVTHGHLVTEFDWESSHGHCHVGYELLRDFAPLARMAMPIRYHHTHWSQLCELGVEPQMARWANLIYLVDRVDALAAQHYANGNLLMQTQRIREQIAGRSGTNFAPELVEIFLAASRSEAFWLNLEARGIQAYLADMLAQSQPYVATVQELKQLATIFSRIVDAKSPFTAEHSLGVARLARFLAEKLGVSAENCDKIEIAGLLHDIGKLRVPDEILDKPAKLDERERKVMNAHSFETYQILHTVPGFEEIAPWAAYHHEEPGGTGYPFRLRAEHLDLEARILRVADIFQAMVQDRPYRQGLSAAEVLGFMRELVARGSVEADIAAVVEADIDGAMAAARPSLALQAA